MIRNVSADVATIPSEIPLLLNLTAWSRELYERGVIMCFPEEVGWRTQLLEERRRTELRPSVTMFWVRTGREPRNFTMLLGLREPDDSSILVERTDPLLRPIVR